MSTSAPLDDLMDRVAAGGRLTPADLASLATTSDILPLGMRADTVRRRLHGSRVTYLRVALCPFDAAIDAIPPSAREIRLTGAPETLEAALSAIESAARVREGRSLSGYSWTDVERFGSRSGSGVGHVLDTFKSAGLDALAEVPLDLLESPSTVLGQLVKAGYERVRVTIGKAAAEVRRGLMQQVATLQEEFGCIHALSPLPLMLSAFRPTTGYDDVKTVALARLAAPNVPSVQVDWLRYGPKLAQVALTFGADDIDNVTASDAAPDGRRRSPLEDVRRNIEAAGFEPAERDGRFAVIA